MPVCAPEAEGLREGVRVRLHLYRAQSLAGCQLSGGETCLHPWLAL